VTGITALPRSRSAVAPRWVIVAAILLATAIVLSAQALAAAGQPAHAVVWGSLGFAAFAASLLCLVGGGQGKALGLGRWWFGSWILLWYCTAFGLATLTWLQPQTGTAAEVSVSSVLRALWLVAVGMTLWGLGYLVGPGQPALRFGNKVMAALSLRFAPEVRSPLAPWILYAIGTAARISTAATTGLLGYVGNAQSAVTTASGYQQLLSDLGLCAPLAVAAAAMQVYRERVPGARVTLTVLVLTEIAYGAASGNKQGFIITTLAVAIPFATARRRAHKGLLAFAGLTLAGLAFLLIVVPFNHSYRSAARNASGILSASQALDAAPNILGQALGTANASGVLSSSTNSLLNRISEIDSPAIIMQRTPAQIGFVNPVQLVTAPIAALVPRAVWPGKPILDSGYEFSQTYYEEPNGVYTSSAITPVGDLYLHGGWVPVLLGMFLLGCGVRLLDDVMDVYGRPDCVFLFLLLFPSLVKQESDWVETLAGIPAILLIWLFATYLTFRKRERPPRNPLWRGPGHTEGPTAGPGPPDHYLLRQIAYSNWGEPCPGSVSSGQRARTTLPRTWATPCSAWATWLPSLARLVPAAAVRSASAQQS
jgi:hypothetical protein